ncbi:MAG: PAS domain S-box protein [Gammaproteobacteria bacterium]|nr:PAS domain S-box protein [Gammaproteobacteria bacterium]
MNAKFHSLRWPWLVLLSAVVFLSAAAWLFVQHRFTHDLLLAQQDSERDLRLVATFLGNELQAGRYQDTERLLHEWGEADRDTAVLRLISANGFVLASFQRPGEPEHSLSLEMPIAYSYRQSATLHLRTDLAEVYQRRDLLALEFIAILLVLSGLLSGLTYFAMLHQREAIRLQQRTHELNEVNRRLVKNEERLRLALDAGSMGIFDWDLATGVIVWSPEHARLFGMRLEDFDGRYESFAQRVHPDDLASLGRAVEIARLSRSLYQREYRIIWPDGTPHWVAGYGHFLYAADGQALRMTGVVMNIDERKLAEAVLEESERRFRAVLEDIQLLGVMLDRQGHIILCNDFLLNLTGWKRDEVSLHNWFDIFLPPDIREKIKNTIFQEAIRSGAVPAHYENEIVTRNGERLTIAWNNILLRDSRGEIVSVASIGEDITQRKHASEALKKSERRLRDLIDGLGPYMFVGLMTPEGILLEANRPALAAANLKLEDVLGKPVEETYWWNYSEEIKQQLRAAIARAARGEASRYDVQVRAGENQFIVIDFSLNPIRDETGKVVFIVPSAIVITERKHAEDALQQLMRELEQRVVERTAELVEINAEMEAFTYTVSHDLRAPLRAVQGMAQALLEDYAVHLDVLGREYAQRLVIAAERMDKLIQDLLSYSRLARAALTVERVSLDDIVRRARELLQADIAKTGAVVQVQKSLPTVLAHAATLEQVVSNLIANAIKFVAPGARPVVKLSAEYRAAGVRLWVEDNGIGIEAEHQQRIFRVFERLHGIETYPGTGIGLAIVHKGVERMDGTVGVESTPGQGSRFWIELPKA